MMRTLLIILLTLSVSQGGINSDPNVIYAEDITTEALKFRVIEERPIFSDKNGARRIGSLKVGTICSLVGFDHRAFKIKGTAKHGRVTGWVSPHALECRDPNFIENFKKLYEREVLVKELIANEEIAIGMTPGEVERVMGKPTKTSLRRTVKGTSGLYEYIEYEKVKHYNTIRDPQTGQTYRRFSHSTQEIKERVAIEFKEDMVSAIEKEEDHSVRSRGPRIITGPLCLDWGHYIVR